LPASVQVVNAFLLSLHRRADVGVRGQYAPADSDDSGVFFRLAWKQVPD
jgi:hypothetical protein